QGTSPERHDLSRLIRNGKRDAPTESIKEPTTVLIARHQSGFDQQLFVALEFQMAQQRIAAARRVSNPETRDRILIQPAILEIPPGRFPFQRPFELLHEKRLRLAVHFYQNRALLILLPLLRRLLLLPRNRDPAFLCNDPN